MNRFERHPKATNAALVCIVLLLGFAGAETLLRVRGGVRDDTTTIRYEVANGLKRFPTNHSFRITNEAGETVEIETDRYGFRNADEVYDDSRPTVVVLGDSYVANVNSEAPRGLVGRLAAGDPGRVFINAGIGGYSNVEMAHALSFLIEQSVVPDRVIAVVYLGNDLRDNYLISRDLEEIPKNEASRFPPPRASAWERLADRFETFGVLNILVQRVSTPRFASYFLSELELWRDDPDSGFLAGAIDATGVALDALDAMTQATGADFGVVLVPSKAQVYTDMKLISKYAVTDGADAEILRVIRAGYSPDNVGSRVEALLEERQVPYLDLTELLRARTSVPRSERLFYQVDDHWNYLGQEVAANRIQEWLSGW